MIDILYVIYVTNSWPFVNIDVPLEYHIFRI